MKVLYICPTPNMYGDNIALLKIIPYLEKHGVEPYFIISKTGAMSEVLNEKKYQYIIFDDIYSTCYSSVLVSVRGFLGFWYRKLFKNKKKDFNSLLDVVKKITPDLIHSNCSFTQLGFNISKELNLKHVWHIREYGLLDAGCHYFPTLNAFINKINCNNNFSIFITDDISKYFGKPAQSMVIYDGVFNQEPPEICIEKSNYFLFVGRLNPVKGISEVIHSYINYCLKESNNNDELWIAGDGNPFYLNQLKRLVYKNNMQNRIKFLGYRTDVYNLMSRAKALVVASKYEAFGFITAEAMFNGCPVIGKNTGGTKMQLDNGVQFFGHEIGFRFLTTSECTDSFIKVNQTSNEELLKIISYAQKTAHSFYKSQQSADLVWNVYEKIIEKKIVNINK